MNTRSSPLRYPGGKSSLYNFTVETILNNSWQQSSYAEPFAGGGGLALSLLYGGYVRDIFLNDLDPAIWAMWYSITSNTDAFIEKIKITEISMEQWYLQKEILIQNDLNNILNLGFAAFFLNRTNRSGIVKGGVIGGKSQLGNYKLDCRFNKEDLIRRITRIGKYSNRINVTRMDGSDFIEMYDQLKEHRLFFIDPPYYEKGAGLYVNSLEHEDHLNLAQTIERMESNWILTYDSVEPIKKMYENFSQYEFDINYSAQKKRVGNELLVTTSNVLVPLTMLNIKELKVA